MGAQVRLIAVLLGVCATALAACACFFLASICITNRHEKISNLLGFDFEISKAECDTLAKDASISIFASKVGQARRTLLFKYGPAGVNPYPVITSVDQHTIQVTVPRVSDVVFQGNNLEGLSVKYDIGVIEYPTK
ncbi:MAG TPA: hypothetical protein VNU65_10990 [Xanthobacteraceae bacterium]|jgi:hypothetical protein|nr:hypothetical protein [Xanthobacteraceae bacterium]